MKLIDNKRQQKMWNLIIIKIKILKMNDQRFQ